MPSIKLNQKLRRVEVDSFEIDNSVVFEYFNKLPANQREDKMFKALYIGVLALMEDRLSAFLAKTTNELGTELESLKMIFDMKQEIFYKTAIKGVLGEEEVAEFLNNFIKEKGLKDTVKLTGNTIGEIPRNKTGDLVCEVDGNPDIKIIIECKFDKSIKLGEISSKDVFTKRMETAWNQLLESQVNRAGRISIIVFDISLIDNSILKSVDDVGFINEIGFIAIVNTQTGDYKNLFIAYMLARDIALNYKEIEYDSDILKILINRVLKDIKGATTVKRLVETNIQNSKEILKQLEKSALLMEFSIAYLSKFLNDGKLSKKDLLEFYMADEVREKFQIVEKDIQNL